MKKLVEEIVERMGRDAALKYQIERKFNPPSAPYFGRSWERLIQIVKKALHHMATEWKTCHPNPKTLRAALIEIEAMINSRPFRHILWSNEEVEVLTPFHFLIGRGVESLPPDGLDTSYVFRQQFKVVFCQGFLGSLDEGVPTYPHQTKQVDQQGRTSEGGRCSGVHERKRTCETMAEGQGTSSGRETQEPPTRREVTAVQDDQEAARR